MKLAEVLLAGFGRRIGFFGRIDARFALGRDQRGGTDGADGFLVVNDRDRALADSAEALMNHGSPNGSLGGAGRGERRRRRGGRTSTSSRCLTPQNQYIRPFLPVSLRWLELKS